MKQKRTKNVNKSNSVKKPRINNNAYRCNICGKIVPPLRRHAHLIIAHKLSGNTIKGLFTDTGRKFVCRKDRVDREIQKEYHRNDGKPKPKWICGQKTGYVENIKILYTPMGNKR